VQDGGCNVDVESNVINSEKKIEKERNQRKGDKRLKDER
jgi:hypothetical protein